MGERMIIRMPLVSSAPVTVRGVLVQLGDSVRCRTPLFDLETDKAVVELPSPVAGVVEVLLVTVGQNVEYDSPLLIVRRSSEAVALVQDGRAG